MLISLVRIFNEIYLIFIILCRSFVHSLGEPEMLALVTKIQFHCLGCWPEVSEHYSNFILKHISDLMVEAAFKKKIKTGMMFSALHLRVSCQYEILMKLLLYNMQ